jgi:hypothetical protein
MPETHNQPHPSKAAQEMPEINNQPHPSKAAQGMPETHNQPHPSKADQEMPEINNQPHPSKAAQGMPETNNQSHPSKAAQGMPETHNQPHPSKAAQGMPETHNQPHPSNPASQDFPAPEVGNYRPSTPNSQPVVTVVTQAVTETENCFTASLEVGVSPVTVEINPPEINWLLQLLEDLETGTQRFTSADELTALLVEAETQVQAQQEPLTQCCPNYWERVMVALALPHNQLPAASPDPTPPEPAAPTLDELKALLLACQTLNQLKTLKQRHGERVDAAYRALAPELQQAVDRVAATAVPYEVSYQLSVISEQLSASISSLITGHCSLFTVKGWQQAVSVSRHCLTLVEKALSAAAELAEPETGNLLDGLT